MNAVSLLESREQRYIKAFNNNNNVIPAKYSHFPSFQVVCSGSAELSNMADCLPHSGQHCLSLSMLMDRYRQRQLRPYWKWTLSADPCKMFSVSNKSLKTNTYRVPSWSLQEIGSWQLLRSWQLFFFFFFFSSRRRLPPQGILDWLKTNASFFFIMFFVMRINKQVSIYRSKDLT